MFFFSNAGFTKWQSEVYWSTEDLHDERNKTVIKKSSRNIKQIFFELKRPNSEAKRVCS